MKSRFLLNIYITQRTVLGPYIVLNVHIHPYEDMIQVMTSMNVKCPNCSVLQASTPILLIYYKPQILYVFGFLYLRRLSLYSKRLNDHVVYILEGLTGEFRKLQITLIANDELETTTIPIKISN